MAQKQHHFLFHIFRLDKAQNPMPSDRIKSLLRYLKKVLSDSTKK